jgi:hypothetical protein
MLKGGTMWRKRASDEDLGFASPRKSETPKPKQPEDDPASYVDSWYQVLKGAGEDEDADLLVENPGDAEPEEGQTDQGQSNQPSRPGGIVFAGSVWTWSKQDEARDRSERGRYPENPLQFQPHQPTSREHAAPRHELRSEDM